jgi:leucyl aminopeptidase
MLKLKSIDLEKTRISTLAVPVCEDENIHRDLLSKLVEQAKEVEEFHGKKDEQLTLYKPAGTQADRVLFIGLGKIAELDPEKLRAFSGKAVKGTIKHGLKDIVIGTPSPDLLPMAEADLVTAILEGACLGNHVFDRYKNKKELKPLKHITLALPAHAVKTFAGLPARVAAICQGTLLARDWVSTPSNDKTPAQLSKAFITLAGKEGLKTTLLSPKQLQQEKFGALMAVGAGSQNTPRLVVLEYAPKGAKKTIALVGKGVTFDAGGINLKPTGGLEDMKIDMSGAAAVAATLITAAKLKPRVRIVGVIPLVENMISGSATRPGDIITSHAGKTIEIGNTDAEGRLILADAMSYTLQKYSPDIMVDVATLTGACVVALGEKIAGLFTSDDALAEAIIKSGQKTHERIWRMPLPEDYKELLKSEIADINNMSSTRYGGAITAALFLSGFAEGTRWAHIDIAGPAHQKKESAYCDAGGTGFGVRLFCDLIDRLK